ncbi:Glucose-induced degradation protein 8 [Spathaspora sp. JA1]|nr:Glucose-induced degradation protein 8 [Spathaspora sp. JA1]
MTNIPKDKIDQLILNYFIQEGYQEAAISFSKELNIDITKTTTTPSTIKENSFIHQLSRINKLDENEFSDVAIDYFNSVSDLNPPPVGGNGSGSRLDHMGGSKLVAGYSTIIPRQEIKLLILKGSITEAIKKISEHFPTILDVNNLLHFKLLRLNLVEMIRNHKLNNMNQDERQFLDDILTFVRENLINKVSNSFKLLKELEITMSLLCFNFDPTVANIEDQKDLPQELRNLFNLSLRNQCYRLVNKAILNLYDFDDEENKFESITHNEDKWKKDNMQIYKGPKFFEFDLSNLDKYEEEEEEDMMEASESLEDEEVEVQYIINSNGGGIMLPSEAVGAGDKDSTSVEEEINKLQSLSLESKLERIVKLWTITEQRLLDLNIIKEKRYILNEEYL